MISIIIGQYNKRIEIINIDTGDRQSELKINKIIFQLDEQEKIKIKEIMETENEYLQVLKILDLFSDEEIKNRNKKYMASTKERNKLKKELSKLREALNKILIEKTNEYKKEDTILIENKREDAYTFISNQFNIPLTTVEFILFILLAVFLVIVAPMGIFMSLGLWKNKEVKNE